MWYLIGLIWIATLAGIVWAYRSKSRKRAAERTKQAAALLSEIKSSLNITAVGAAATVQAAAVPVRKFAKRQRWLPQSAALLYYVFRAGLPDHEIFVGLTLSDIVEIESASAGYDQEHAMRKLSQCKLDLVVCTKQLEVVAAVLRVADAVGQSAQVERVAYTQECLQSAGVRLVCISTKTTPRHHEVHELIYGTQA